MNSPPIIDDVLGEANAPPPVGGGGGGGEPELLSQVISDLPSTGTAYSFDVSSTISDSSRGDIIRGSGGTPSILKTANLTALSRLQSSKPLLPKPSAQAPSTIAPPVASQSSMRSADFTRPPSTSASPNSTAAPRKKDFSVLKSYAWKSSKADTSVFNPNYTVFDPETRDPEPDGFGLPEVDKGEEDQFEIISKTDLEEVQAASHHHAATIDTDSSASAHVESTEDAAKALLGADESYLSSRMYSIDGEDDMDSASTDAAIAEAVVTVLAPSQIDKIRENLLSIVDSTSSTAGNVVDYTKKGLSDFSNKWIFESIDKLVRATEMPVLSLATDVATETFSYVSDRSRLMVNHLVYMLQKDLSHAQRLHLRRLLASGSWVEFSKKCQLATLPWYERQLVHLTRDLTNYVGKDVKRQMRELDESLEKRAESQKLKGLPPSGNNDATASSSSTQAIVNAKAQGRSSADSSGTNGSGDEDEQFRGVDVRNRLSLMSMDRNTSADDIVEFQRWILTEAAAGNDDAEYALVKWFTPPSFAESDRCYTCQSMFGFSRFRHHCRHCGKSFCGDHSQSRRAILKYGMGYSVRVCDKCAEIVDREIAMDRKRWKKYRLDDYYAKKLVPYFEVAMDSGADKAYRIGVGSLYLVRSASIALTYPVLIAAETLEILRKYGLVGLAGILLRNDFIEAVEALKQITSMDERYPLSIRQMTACIYYKLAIERGLRGCDPDGEFRAHGTCGLTDAQRKQADYNITRPGATVHQLYAEKEEETAESACKNVDNDSLEELIRYSSLALMVSYEESAIECQRLAKLQGFQMILFNGDSDPERPAHSIFASDGDGDSIRSKMAGVESPPVPARREAVLVVRGTHTIQDVVTDLRADPIVFPPSDEEIDGIFSGRIGAHDYTGGKSSRKFAHEVNWMVPKEGCDYACRGIARAALFLFEEVGPTMVDLYQSGHDIRVVGHSLGGAVAALVAYLLRRYIPEVRALCYSPPSVLSLGLANEMNDFVVSCTLHDDIISRVTPESIRLLMRELMVFRDQVFRFVEQDWYDAIKRTASAWTPRWRDATAIGSEVTKRGPMLSAPPDASSKRRPSASMSSDVAAFTGINSQLIGADAKVHLHALTYVSKNNAIAEAAKSGKHLNESDCLPHSGPSAEEESFESEEDEGDDGNLINTAEDRALVVGAIPVAQLWLPGRIMHIYTHRGVYRLAEVPKDFPSMRRIEIQGDIFNDHRSRSVYDALLEVRAVRNTSCGPPEWTSFDASTVCQKCHSSFTWHTTCQGDAQELRERFNCRSCGALVCGPCSSNSAPISRLGLILPARICDACFHLGHYSLPVNPAK